MMQGGLFAAGLPGGSGLGAAMAFGNLNQELPYFLAIAMKINLRHEQ
jgi:hypothetical protein